MEKEIWKDIPEFEGYYQISNLGRVKSLERMSNGKYLKERIMKNIKNGNYEVVMLSKGDQKKTIYVQNMRFRLFS